MIALAGLALSGRMWSLPSFLRAPDTTRGDTASFFSLGMFSGIASSCCAPVLAGVMTLSVLSGSPIGGLALGLAYVFGMVFPLFVMAMVWDKARLGERKLFQARTVRLCVAGRTLVTNTLNIAVAVGFAVMGVFVIALAGSKDMTGGSAFQDAASRTLTDVFAAVQEFLSPVPEPLQGLALLAVAAVFIWATVVDRRRPGRPKSTAPATATAAAGSSDGPAAPVPSCHATPTTEEVTR